jgi:hypothetical protein
MTYEDFTNEIFAMFYDYDQDPCYPLRQKIDRLWRLLNPLVFVEETERLVHHYYIDDKGNPIPVYYCPEVTHRHYEKGKEVSCTVSDSEPLVWVDGDQEWILDKCGLNKEIR